MQASPLGAEAQDFIVAFFQSSHSVRDALLHARAVPLADLDALYKSNRPLRIGQDIASGVKQIDLATAKVGETSEMSVQIDGTKIDVFDLARRSVSAWDTFLRSKRLLQ